MYNDIRRPRRVLNRPSPQSPRPKTEIDEIASQNYSQEPISENDFRDAIMFMLHLTIARASLLLGACIAGIISLTLLMSASYYLGASFGATTVVYNMIVGGFIGYMFEMTTIVLKKLRSPSY